MICEKCGSNMILLSSLNEIVFPIGKMTTEIQCNICQNCHNVFFDENCSKIRCDNFEMLKTSLLKKKGLDFNGNPDLYADESEFFDMTGQIITNENRNWFLKGLFGVSINEHAFFLKKSIDEYIHTDYGMFWLTDNLDFDQNRLMIPGCPWCGIGNVLEDGNGKFQCQYCGEKMNHLILRKAV